MHRIGCAALGVAYFLMASPAGAQTGGFVRGVVAAAGRPVRGATVVLSREGTTLRTRTDATGAFSFARVPYGRYDLAVGAERLATVRQSVEVRDGGVVVVASELGPREIARTVETAQRGAANEPVAVTTIGRAQILTSPENRSLGRLIESVPGIVRYAYDEPVAHGFHGITYELDGIPLPRGSVSNLGEIVDPRNIDALEIFTGAYPAEYGGSRLGAVVDISTRRANDLARPSEGDLTVGGGGYGSAQVSLAEAARAGGTTVFVNANLDCTNRGIDSPTFDPVHDAANRANVFVRTITALSAHETLSIDASSETAGFQIPINPTQNPNDRVVNAPGTNDVQNESASALALSYVRETKDGHGYVQAIPWYRTDRIRYEGDLANDLAGSVLAGDGATSPPSGLRQDRRSAFAGLRTTYFRASSVHAIKAGLDAQIENFRGTETIASLAADGTASAFADDASRRGSQLGLYVQDKWTPIAAISVFGGLRLDRSTGYVSGGQLSPRLEIDGAVTKNDVLHAYFGRLYAAPTLEDTRRAAVVTAGGAADAPPSYDLKPERDSSYEFGIAHVISPRARASVNLWKRDVTNVLDTTQLAQTPVQAVYNNAVGIAKGVDARLETRGRNGDSAFVSATFSKAVAGGISGGTFLFCPPPATADCRATNADVTLQPEDHDQTLAVHAGYTKRFAANRAYFATLEPQYATGYPVAFQNGTGRLPPHLTVDASFGRAALRPDGSRGLGFVVDFENLAGTAYLLKVNNGFNTTQWGTGFKAGLRVTQPF